jgi:hypothetical protein
MHRKLLAIFLIISLQSVTFAMLLVDTGFKLNQKFIAEKLCENRNKPMLQCHGKCYLMKMKKKAAEQKQEQDNQLTQTQFQQLFCNEVLTIVFFPLDTGSFQPPVNNNGRTKGWPARTYRPPGFV